MMSDGFNMGFGGGFMWLFWILVIISIACVFVIVMGGKKEPAPKQKAALNILKERYAKGEIDQQEFEQKRKDLGEL